MYILLAQGEAPQTVTLQAINDDASDHALGIQELPLSEFAARVAELEAREQPRWVWDNTQRWYPQLLAVNVRVERCHDLTLCQNILMYSEFAAATGYGQNLRRLPEEILSHAEINDSQEGLFDRAAFDSSRGTERWSGTDIRTEFFAQKRAISSSTHPARLALLLIAESASALVAAEMQYEGIPWREDIHRRLLNETLGPEPADHSRPAKMEALAQELRTALGAQGLNPDSPQDLIRALHRAGIEAKSTRNWELKEFTHPAIDPLLRYRKLSRLFTSNGWAWLKQWVRNGRFHSEYVVGGVVSGRWASRGGGALQIPKQIRGAALADEGWKLIVADAAQLEPRVLAALAQDTAMAAAGQDKDLYAGIAAQGFGGDRSMAKIALLGAIYGATTGESGRLMPQLSRMYPQAIGLVEKAARMGEHGQAVSTHLGRSTPSLGAEWAASQRSSTAEEQRRAESIARSRGRFTRNFVVQGTAAEWAACWLAELRRRIRSLDVKEAPQLVFFLHDEVMVHCPDELVDQLVTIVDESAKAATRLLFGQIPLEFPVNIVVVEAYSDAK